MACDRETDQSATAVTANKPALQPFDSSVELKFGDSVASACGKNRHQIELGQVGETRPLQSSSNQF